MARSGSSAESNTTADDMNSAPEQKMDPQGLKWLDEGLDADINDYEQTEFHAQSLMEAASAMATQVL